MGLEELRALKKRDLLMVVRSSGIRPYYRSHGFVKHFIDGPFSKMMSCDDDNYKHRYISYKCMRRINIVLPLTRF